MPNIGTTGFILIILVALLLFGPSKLPELGRAFGRTLREFKSGAKDMMNDSEQENRKEVSSSDSSQRFEKRSDEKKLPE
ncbi:MAG: hypothetical protein K0R67_1677 [Paenibacillus sp.]|jgi:sec-independent protein translocase protein TatA|nr:hypothetical protein [Paenibacillus sp.]